MKTPDVNLLLYSVNKLSPHHIQAAKWLGKSFDNSAGVGFAWIVLVGFLRLATQSKVMPIALPLKDALSVVDEWLAHPNGHILQPTERHNDILARLLLTMGTAGNLTNDAHLATLAIEHGATIGSFDRDFKKFPGVKLDLLA
jgi:uncharacterized protein